MYAIDYDSLERARAKDRVKAVKKVQQLAADNCLDEIEAVNPGYYDELVDALYEPAEDFYARQELPLLEGDEDDDDFEPCAYAYEHGLCPELDGHYNLPDILGNAIYYKPTAAELARAEHNRTYGITEGDEGIYSILFDSSGRPRGGKSGIRRNRRTKAEVEAARKEEAKAKRKEERERAKLLARVAAQRA
jgi:hypothetical protein